MSFVARAEPGAHLSFEDHVFDFGTDGTRQVTEPEKQALARYALNGGALKVTVSEQKTDSRPDSKGGK